VTSIEFWDKFNDRFLEELSQFEDEKAIKQVEVQEARLKNDELKKAEENRSIAEKKKRYERDRCNNLPNCRIMVDQ
jgi:hypothetical protein